MRVSELNALAWEEVSSTNIARLAFSPSQSDPSVGTLFVHFYAEGEQSIYRYFDVPESVYVTLRQARSVGGMHRKIVRDKFRYERLTVEPDEPEEELLPGEKDPVVIALELMAERIAALEAEVANLVRLMIGQRRPRTVSRPASDPLTTVGPRRRKQ
jgi:KTSC domain